MRLEETVGSNARAEGGIVETDVDDGEFPEVLCEPCVTVDTAVNNALE